MMLSKTKKSNRRKATIGFSALACCAAALALNAGGRAQQTAHTSQPSSQSSKPATAAAKELSLIDLDGYRKLVAEHRGKPLLVTFWATWCEPCREEYPLVNQLAREFGPQGLDVVGVDMDDDAALTLVRHFLEKNQPVFPNVRKKMGHEDAFVDGVDPRWHDVMPANFFYTADGQLAGFMTGGQPRENFEKVIHVILAARGGAVPHP
jgi:thiol-disulfide isomerase/thioredoxin